MIKLFSEHGALARKVLFYVFSIILTIILFSMLSQYYLLVGTVKMEVVSQVPVLY